MSRVHRGGEGTKVTCVRPAGGSCSVRRVRRRVFGGYYVDVRRAPTSPLVDYTPTVLYVAIASLLLGVLAGRWWAIVMPLVAFVVAPILLLIGTLDDRYSAVAPDRGGVLGPEWFGVAALYCVYAVPAAAFGVGLHVCEAHHGRVQLCDGGARLGWRRMPTF